MAEGATHVHWINHHGFLFAIEQSNSTGKPILLYFHSNASAACRRLEIEIFSNSQVVEAFSKNTIPVRIDVDNDAHDPTVKALIGSHVFIWSSAIQLVSATGDIHHKFLGGPLYTRLALGGTGVHVDIDGALSKESLLAQLSVGLGKWSLHHEEYRLAQHHFSEVRNHHHNPDQLACREADYWNAVAVASGAYPEDSLQRITAPRLSLGQEVERFCEVLIRISDDELMRDWRGSPGNSCWSHYTDCLREVVLSVYQSLIDLANQIEQRRTQENKSLTTAQLILKRWHVAYRQLRGRCVGLKGADLDRQHFGRNFSLGKQRTIRNNLVHCVTAEFWAHAPAIRRTISRARSGNDFSSVNTETPLDIWEKYGPPPFNFGNFLDLLTIYERRHTQLISEFASITDAELDAGMCWWERTAITVRFRLNRLGWHLQDHCAVIETICERIGRVRTETERLAFRIFEALGEAEGAAIGFDIGLESFQVCENIRKLIDELESIYRLSPKA